MSSTLPFWETTPMEQMTPEQWESLCDGCAQCCLHKLEDEESGDIYFTRVVCKLLDIEKCQCTQYEQRHILNPECIELTPEVVKRLHWLPETCAYRRLAFHEALPSWHPLITGDKESVHQNGISVRGRVISENEIDMDELDLYLQESD
ncbi:MAG: YcgN family cysteine cluster protein [Anaerolineaceae bacterium]